MASPVESHAATNDVDESVEPVCSSKSITLSDELRDTVDKPATEEPNFEETFKHKRKKTSEVWNYFVTKEVKEKGKTVQKLECLYCKQRYKGVMGGPTTSLRRHIDSCASIKKAQGKSQGLLKFESCDSTNVLGVNPSGVYEQLKCREIISKMIIAHELPFTFVEYQWFNILMKYVNPLYQKVSRATIKNECIKVFESEKEKLKKVFKGVDRISLTSDCWTSNQTIGYMCLTAHYVDSDWKLQKRIISFNELAPPHNGEVISDAILESLIKWGIQDKIGTITLDNASNNDWAAAILKFNFHERGKLHFEGLFFHVRCCAHILNLVVQDGLSKIDGCIRKIRNGVKYLKKTPARLLKFGEIAKNLGIQTSRSLCSDVKTRWNSTHRMLESAIYYKSTFHGYQLRDTNFVWLPTKNEWIKAEKLCKLLQVFLNATNLFSGSLYPTANLFLVEVFRVKKVIYEAYHSGDEFLVNMSGPMFEKFDKYWGEIGVLMAIASILDPRFKLLSVDFTFKRLYPVNEVGYKIVEVTSKFKSLYEKYSKVEMTARKAAKAAASTSDSAAAAVYTDALPKEDDFYAFLMTTEEEEPPKSDLEVYLEEPRYSVKDEGVTFDVLKWWNQNSSKYPILSKLVCDVLCIPITTVASESAFSAGGRILDDYRSSLSKDMVEILVCGSDWIKANSKTIIQTLQKSAKEEENLEIQIPTSND